MKLKYKDYQIIKHALQTHIEREGATEKDKLEETKLLNKVSTNVERLKEEYGL